MCLLTSCVHRNLPQATPAEQAKSPGQLGYDDLRPGARVIDVFPKLRSGGYVLPSMQETAAGNTINVKPGSEFEGYEKDFYNVAPGNAGGVQVHFSRAEVWENGKSQRQPNPSLPLFERMTSFSYVRLVYLVRESNADHDMAIRGIGQSGVAGKSYARRNPAGNMRSITEHCLYLGAEGSGCQAGDFEPNVTASSTATIPSP
jgi:hypothetical protein